jgi:predicted thioredoxin/glutaredoxin
LQRHNSHLKKKWGFTCHCELCEADRTEDLELKQSMMEDQFKRLPMLCALAAGRIGAPVEQTGQAGYEKVREFAEWLDETYAPGRRVKVELAKVKLMLGDTAVGFDDGLSIKVSLVGLPELTPQRGLDPGARALWRRPRL